MIKIKLDEVFKEKDVWLTELSPAIDVIIPNLSILKTVHFSTLEAICKYLECQPGNIIVYEES